MCREKIQQLQAASRCDVWSTPVMLMHGENDSDVPIAESEQFFIALQKVWRCLLGVTGCPGGRVPARQVHPRAVRGEADAWPRSLI
jgi:hypothetical protein